MFTQNKIKHLEGFEYIPSLNIYVAKERTLLGEGFYPSQEMLHKNGERMLTPFEFLEFLKYSKINLPEIYQDITKTGDSWRAEWIDADFKTKGKNLCLLCHSFDETGKINLKIEILDKDTLMEDKKISLNDLIENHTNQGLPTTNINSGGLDYESPNNMNNSVARFDAYQDRAILSYGHSASNWEPYIGVRAVRKA